MKYEYIEKRDKLVAQKLLKCQSLGDLRIYNYVMKKIRPKNNRMNHND